MYKCYCIHLNEFLSFSFFLQLIPTDMEEREFWRIVSSIDEDVTVEYGADLHTMDHGSGFPTKNSKNLLPADQVRTPLQTIPQTLLHLTATISKGFI